MGFFFIVFLFLDLRGLRPSSRPLGVSWSTTARVRFVWMFWFMVRPGSNPGAGAGSKGSMSRMFLGICGKVSAERCWLFFVPHCPASSTPPASLHSSRLRRCQPRCPGQLLDRKCLPHCPASSTPPASLHSSRLRRCQPRCPGQLLDRKCLPHCPAPACARSAALRIAPTSGRLVTSSSAPCFILDRRTRSNSPKRGRPFRPVSGDSWRLSGSDGLTAVSTGKPPEIASWRLKWRNFEPSVMAIRPISLTFL